MQKEYKCKRCHDYGRIRNIGQNPNIPSMFDNEELLDKPPQYKIIDTMIIPVIQEFYCPDCHEHSNRCLHPRTVTIESRHDPY